MESVATAGQTMARSKGRPKKPGGEGVPVRIDSDIIAKARYLAAEDDVPLSEYLSLLMRPVVEREFKKKGRNMLEGESE